MPPDDVWWAPLPRLSATAVRVSQALAGLAAPLSFVIGDRPMAVFPCLPLPRIETALVEVTLIADDHAGAVFVPVPTFERLIDVLAPDLGIAAVDGEMAALLLETAFAPLLDALEAISGCSLSLAELAMGDLPQAEEGLTLALVLGGQPIGGVICHLPAAALDKLASAAWRLPRSEAGWDHLPVSVSLTPGTSTLALQELETLEAGDVALFDHQLYRENKAAATCADGWVFDARPVDHGIAVTSALRRASPQDQDLWMDTQMADHGERPDSALDDLPVKLVFEFARQELTLNELKALGPGYIFDLGRDPKTLIEIYANGRHVGRGEIVRVDQELGVRVTQLFGR